jgi:predicted dehydrogenase
LGRIMTMQARVVTSQVRYRDPSHWLFRRETAGSGILSWLGIHRLDLLTYLTGQRVRRVAALTATLNNEEIDVEDTATLALEYDGGALATFLAGYLLPGARPGYEGTPSDSYLALHGYDGWVTWGQADPPSYTFFSTAEPWLVGQPEERRFELPPSGAYGGAHGLEFMRDSLRACRLGTPAACPIEDAVYALDVIEAALRASATGTVQDVHY